MGRLLLAVASLSITAKPASAQSLLTEQNVPLASLASLASTTAPGGLNRFLLSAEAVAGTTGAPRLTGGGHGEYDDLIGAHAGQNALRPELVKAVVRTESAFNPKAVSPKGALGLMQLMPATARQFGVSNALDPAENIRAGTAYLRQLLNRYDNNEALALAAYNAGPGAVDRYGRTVPPYRETQHYVAKVTNLVGDSVRVPGTPIYKVTESVEGQPVVTYTNKAPR